MSFLTGLIVGGIVGGNLGFLISGICRMAADHEQKNSDTPGGKRIPQTADIYTPVFAPVIRRSPRPLDRRDD